MSVADDLVRAGQLLTAAGLSPGSTGNLSVRAGDRITCTPSGTRLGALAADALSVLTMTGEHIKGPKPTKEWPMHLACYQEAPGVRAVVHLHSTHATAWSVLDGIDPDDALPALTPYLTMKAGKVKLVPYAKPGDPVLAGYASDAVRHGYRALLMSNHGSLAVGSSLDAAVTIAEELEESAKIALLLRPYEARALSAEQTAELRAHS